MPIIDIIQQATVRALKESFDQDFGPQDFQVNQTKPEFEGDYTVVLFGLLKRLKGQPEVVGKQLGERLLKNETTYFQSFNVIKGFLNLTVTDDYWIGFLRDNYLKTDYGRHPSTGRKVMVEYSSPNTNKPLHLGHLRNNFLGWSTAELLGACGNEVVKTCIVNDRGVHICKSMLAWQKYAHGATPASTGKKGDHFVGDYYVLFENDLKQQSEPLIQQALASDLSGFLSTNQGKLTAILKRYRQESDLENKKELTGELRELARNATPLMEEVRQMLIRWEQGEPATLQLWEMMNGWVYEGFEETYQRIGVDFDKTYYESQTYLLGKEYVEQGLDKGIFFRKEDGSVWIDLTKEGLDEKLLLRRDGTSVYITQDLGLAQLKYDDFKIDESIYVIADEQDYHMKVLTLILQKLALPYAAGIHHLSYGLVELPSGRMKSREGTVVDADDLVDLMIREAAVKTREQGKTEGFSEDELRDLYEIIGLGGLKFFLLRVDPRKRMVFNPDESIDLHGFTATFIQYAHARIKSILRKEGFSSGFPSAISAPLLPEEKGLLILLEQYPAVIAEAAKENDPSKLANYAYLLAKNFNGFYANLSVSNAESEEKKKLRLCLCVMTAGVIRSSMALLGIRVPERM